LELLLCKLFSGCRSTWITKWKYQQGGDLLAYCLIMLSVLFSSISIWVGRKKDEVKQTDLESEDP
jgi:hypothetical protein